MTAKEMRKIALESDAEITKLISNTKTDIKILAQKGKFQKIVETKNSYAQEKLAKHFDELGFFIIIGNERIDNKKELYNLYIIEIYWDNQIENK